MAEVGKAGADVTPPLPRAPSAVLWDETSADSMIPSAGV